MAEGCLRANGIMLRIVRGRTGRRPFGGSPGPLVGLNSAPEQPTQVPFANIDPNILNNNATIDLHQQDQQPSASFTQPNGLQGANLFGVSQSFPPNSSSTNQPNNLASSFGGFASNNETSSQSAAPASTFNFAPAATVNNPFSPGNTPIIHPRSWSGTVGSIGGGSTGFKGAIFNIPAGRDSVPQFAPIPSEPSNNLFGQIGQGTQPQAASTTSGNASNSFEQTPKTTNLFGQSGVQFGQKTPTASNFFGQSIGSTSQFKPTSNLFGQLGVETTQKTPTASNLFGQSISSTSQFKPSSNLFGQSGVDTSQKTPTVSKTFGQSIGSTSQFKQSSNIFGQSADNMQTSPDATPAKSDAPKPELPSFLSQAPKSTATGPNTPSSNVNLISKGSQPSSGPNAVPPSKGASTEHTSVLSETSRSDATVIPSFTAPQPSSSSGLFSGLLMPPSDKQPPKSRETPKLGSSSKLFSGLLMPPSAKSPLESKVQPSSTTTGLFAGLSKPSNLADSNKPTIPAVKTPVQKDNITNGVDRASAVTQAKAGSETSNIFKSILEKENSKDQPVGVQNDKLTNGINGVTPLPQTTEKTQLSNGSNQTLEISQVEISGADGNAMGLPPPAPAHFTETQKQQYNTAFRIRSLNRAFQKQITTMVDIMDIEPAVRFYLDKREKIIAASGLPMEALTSNKRKFSDEETLDKGDNSNKKAKLDSPSSIQAAAPATQTPITKDKLANGINETAPAPQAKEGSNTPNIFKDSLAKPRNAVENGTTGASAVKPPVFSVPTFKAPTFGSGNTVNFMAQFGQSVEETERKEKAKRKAEDFDSDEDDEAEWERKYAEEQRAKKQKLAEAAKGKTAKFIPGKGFVFSESEQTNGAVTKDNLEAASASKSESNTANPLANNGTGLFGSGASTPSTAGGASVFDSPNFAGQHKSISSNNIFGHLSDADSGADGSKTGDADDEDTASDADEDQNAKGINGNPPAQNSPFKPSHGQHSSSDEADDIQTILRESVSTGAVVTEKAPSDEQTPQPTAPGKSLFDRITKDGNGNNMRELPSAKENTSNGPAVDMLSASATPIFGKPHPSITSFGQKSSSTPATNIFGSFGSPSGDHTWKQDTPIKFGGSTTQPMFNFISPTPSKSTFGEDKGTSPSPLTGLFGHPKPTAESPAKPTSNLFGSPSTTESPLKITSNLFGAPSTKSAEVGFGFGGPPKIAASSLLAPSAPTSGATSRATSPGLTTDTGGESANDTAEGTEAESAGSAQQLNLTSGGPGEEEEDVLFEVRAKAMMWAAESKDENKGAGWSNKGVGPFRVLKHRKNSKARIIMRLDPSGRLVLNAALLSGVTYQHQAPAAVKMAIASEDGKLNTWVIKVKKDEDAKNLANILEENKAN